MVSNPNKLARKPAHQHATQSREEARHPPRPEVSLQEYQRQSPAHHEHEEGYSAEFEPQELAGDQPLDANADGLSPYALTSPHPPVMFPPFQPYAIPQKFSTCPATAIISSH
jgi:hypothetical protein